MKKAMGDYLIKAERLLFCFACFSILNENDSMSVQELETAVSELSREDLAAFRRWFVEFDEEAWDKQFEEDVATGRLNNLAEEALSDLREGRTTAL
jgi:hypothetical protein